MLCFGGFVVVVLNEMLALFLFSWTVPDERTSKLTSTGLEKQKYSLIDYFHSLLFII